MGIFRKNKKLEKEAKEIITSSLVNDIKLSEVVDLVIKDSENKANKIIKKMKSKELESLVSGKKSLENEPPPPKKSLWKRISGLFEDVENTAKKALDLHLDDQTPPPQNSSKPKAIPKKKISNHRFKSPKKKISNHRFKRGKPDDDSKPRKKPQSKSKLKKSHNSVKKARSKVNG